VRQVLIEGTADLHHVEAARLGFLGDADKHLLDDTGDFGRLVRAGAERGQNFAYSVFRQFVDGVLTSRDPERTIMESIA
jgi:hypothetical protein